MLELPLNHQISSLLLDLPNMPLSTGRARLCPGRSGGDSWPEWAARPSCKYQTPGVGEPSASQTLAEFPHPSLSRFSLLQGQKGQPGVPGVPGSPGSPGPPGISIKVSLEHSSGMCHRKRRPDSKNCRWRSLETSPKALLPLGVGILLSWVVSLQDFLLR